MWLWILFVGVFIACLFNQACAAGPSVAQNTFNSPVNVSVRVVFKDQLLAQTYVIAMTAPSGSFT